MDNVSICCDVKCGLRFECRKFSNALDVNSGKITNYEIIECVNQNYYEK